MASKLHRVFSRLPTYTTYIRERPSWLVVLLFGRFLFMRAFERWANGAKVRRIVVNGASRISVENQSAVVPALLKDGVYLGLRLDPEDVTAIVSFAKRTKVSTRRGPRQDFYAGDVVVANSARETDVIAGYFFDRVRDCPNIGMIERDPLLAGIANGFIGSPAIHIRTRLWWTFPGERVTQEDLHAAAQNKFHFDLNDFRTIKFFFYLTDVDTKSGAHTYIAGSHRRRSLAHQFTMMVGHEDEVLRHYYGDAAIKTVTGPAGIGFAEDPFVFHHGMLCRENPRLLLEIEFGPRAMSPSYRYGVLG